MEIVGTGFLAGHLAALADRHEDAVALAAGVSSARDQARSAYDREAALVAATARRCRDTGRRLVFFSTSSPSMYGLLDGPGREDVPVRPADAYGRHKHSMEELVRASGADHLILRTTSLAGPRQQPHQLLPTLVRSVREGRVLIHKGAARDLLWVGDAVRIVDLLLEHGVRRETVNVAGGHAVPVEEIIDHIERRLRTPVEREYRDGGVAAPVAVDKLGSLAPETAELGFGPGYHCTVVDAFLASEVSDV